MTVCQLSVDSQIHIIIMFILCPSNFTELYLHFMEVCTSHYIRCKKAIVTACARKQEQEQGILDPSADAGGRTG